MSEMDKVADLIEEMQKKGVSGGVGMSFRAIRIIIKEWHIMKGKIQDLENRKKDKKEKK